MAKTLEEMINDIGQFGESLNDLQPEIETLMTDVVFELKKNAPSK